MDLEEQYNRGGWLSPLGIRFFPTLPTNKARVMVMLGVLLTVSFGMMLGCVTAKWMLPLVTEFHDDHALSSKQLDRVAYRALVSCVGTSVTIGAVLLHATQNYRGKNDTEHENFGRVL